MRYQPLQQVWQKSITLMAILAVLGVPVTTESFFTNLETSTAQGFVATELILETPAPIAPVTVGPGVSLSEVRIVPILTTEASTESFFELTSQAVSSDGLFCDALKLSASWEAFSVSSHPDTLDSASLTDYGDWQLTLDYDVTQHDFETGATCTITLSVEAWQASMSQETAGYRDTTEVELVVTADMSLVDSLHTLGARASVAGLPLTQLSILLDEPEIVEVEPVEAGILEPTVVESPIVEEPVEPAHEDLPEVEEVDAQPEEEVPEAEAPPEPEPTPEETS